MDCVTNTAALVKFTHKNLRGVTQEFYYMETLTILHNYKYVLYKQSYSKLLNIYSMIITKLDYSDEGKYTCHMSDGRRSHSRVVVLRQNSKCLKCLKRLIYFKVTHPFYKVTYYISQCVDFPNCFCFGPMIFLHLFLRDNRCNFA